MKVVKKYPSSFFIDVTMTAEFNLSYLSLLEVPLIFFFMHPSQVFIDLVNPKSLSLSLSIYLYLYLYLYLWNCNWVAWNKKNSNNICRQPSFSRLHIYFLHLTFWPYVLSFFCLFIPSRRQLLWLMPIFLVKC